MKIKILVAESAEQLTSVANKWLLREGFVKTIISIQYSTTIKVQNSDEHFHFDGVKSNIIEYSVCICYED